jgi:hypothetical protein
MALIGDLHINSTVGLPPGLSFPLDDGGMYHASKTQRWIWDCWGHFWALIDEMVKRHKAELFVVINGEALDGDHHDTRQIITRNRATFMRMGTYVLDPIAQKADHLFWTRGTPAHSGKSGELDEGLAQDLGAEPARVVNGEVTSYTFWHLRLDVRGVKSDICHHTTRSKVPRSKGSSAGRLASDTQERYIDQNQWPPDLVFRSHVHVSEDSRDSHRTRAIILPCWQAPTEYGYKIAPGDWPTIGGAWVLCQDGQYTAEVERYPLKEEQLEWITF